MTTPPAQQPAAQPAPAGQHITINWRAAVSVLETVAYVCASVLAAMNNGSDFRNAIITVFVGLVMHGVNHNAGGSPV